jgi:hypothetical protein
MDFISWCEYVYYTSPLGGVGPDDILVKTIKPSWKTGFNMIWTIMNGPGGYIRFPWDQQATGMPMPLGYAWSNDERWQVEGYRKYLGYTRERNMMEMLYWPGVLPGVPVERARPGAKASAVKGFDKIYNSLLYHSLRLSDAISNERYCTTNPQNTLYGSRELALAHVNQLLESNPGAFAVNYISGYDSARACMVGDFPNGLEPYSSGYFKGFEDALMFAPDPWLLRAKGGKKYRWIEFWTEDGELVPKDLRRKPVYNYDGGELKDNWYGGHIGEDYIVKQMNDIARLRLLDSDRYNTLTGITWYTDGLITSESNIEMAHVVSQDPIRAAVAGQLRSLGKSGRIRSLYPYSTKSYFMNNNYLALFLPEGKTHTELLYDLQRTAHFTPFSYSLPLGCDFLSTSGTVESVDSKVIERGGYRAVIQSESHLQVEQGQIKETRTYELTSDAPYLTVTIKDEVTNPETSLIHTLIGKGFDKLLADGKAVTASVTLTLPKIALLRDTSGFRPDVALLFLEAPKGASLDWKPGQSLTIKRPAADPLRFALVVPTDLYNSEQLLLLAEELSQPSPVLLWEDGPKKITNDSPLPVTQVVTLQGSDDRPYLVEESGWWTFRGAQVSKQQQNTDYLKVYLQPRETASILPWDFISGVARHGWGCQYILALREVKATSDGAVCKVKVLSETPMIFAPRIEFSFPIAEVKLNGKSWYYFDGQHVFLPQNRGQEYELKVVRGKPLSPHLSRTYVNVKSMAFSDNELTIKASAPPWRPRIPEGLRLTAQIEHPDRELSAVAGGQRIKEKEISGRSIIHVEPGTVKIRFQ